MKKSLMIIAALTLAAATGFAAPTIALHSANAGIGTMSFSVSGSTIDIWEDWTNSGRGFLLVRGLDTYQNYVIVKHITNNTGTDWTRFANEILDPAGDGNDYYDKPTESWVPAGFTHSSEYDGVSFAQGSGIPRTSTAFASREDDELASRDYIDFFGGTVDGNGGTDVVSFGLRDNAYNQPFILSQRPNEATGGPVVPEPMTLVLFGLGLAGVAIRKRFSK